jgi:hypothetical protein
MNKMEFKQITDIPILTIKEFKRRFLIDKTVEGIGYDMKLGKIDYCQPLRDRFVVVTDRTKLYYELIYEADGEQS